jgi:antitoxin HicB
MVKKAMRYTAILEEEAYGGYSVGVPALPGCHSQGDTREEALANIREAIELYVETLREAGETIPTEAGKEFVESLGVHALSRERAELGSSDRRDG